MEKLGRELQQVKHSLPNPPLRFKSSIPAKGYSSRKLQFTGSPAEDSLGSKQGRCCEIEQWDCDESQRAINGGGES
jgi:hypothetical protein